MDEGERAEEEVEEIKQMRTGIAERVEERREGGTVI